MEYSAKIQLQGRVDMGESAVTGMETGIEMQAKSEADLQIRGFIQDLALICVPRPSSRRIWEKHASQKEGI